MPQRLRPHGGCSLRESLFSRALFQNFDSYQRNSVVFRSSTQYFTYVPVVSLAVKWQ